MFILKSNVQAQQIALWLMPGEYSPSVSYLLMYFYTKLYLLFIFGFLLLQKQQQLFYPTFNFSCALDLILFLLHMHFLSTVMLSSVPLESWILPVSLTPRFANRLETWDPLLNCFPISFLPFFNNAHLNIIYAYYTHFLSSQNSRWWRVSTWLAWYRSVFLSSVT